MKYNDLHPRTYAAQVGLGMVELLITFVICAISISSLLLGQNNVMTKTHATVHSSRVQLYADSLAERLFINSGVALTTSLYAINYGAPPSATDCNTQSCDAQALAAFDLRQWKEQLKANIPDGDGKVSFVDLSNNVRRYTIEIAYLVDNDTQTVTREVDL